MISLVLATRFDCVNMTPLGDPVEPLVYCNTASESPLILGRRHFEMIRVAGSSVPSNCTPTKSSWYWSPVSCSTTALVDNAQRASASTTIDRIRDALRLRRGGKAGTAIAPAA